MIRNEGTDSRNDRYAGKAVAEALMERWNCELILFSRHAEEVFGDLDGVTAISGDALDIESLRKVMPGVDAVYFTVSGSDAPQGVKNTMDVMREFGVRRIVAMSAIGVYNEIPESIGAENNLDNEPEQ